MENNTSTHTCTHETTEWLGFNGAMEFFRCVDCRSVVVVQGGKTIVIPATQTAPLAADA